jgi:hypothetical protein
MTTYSADALIGKTLIAAKPVPIKRLPMDSAPVVFTVAVGQPVGIVSSYVNPTEGRSRLYWMFRDKDGRYYYSEHVQGLYSLSALTDQGVLTTKQETEAAADANKKFNLAEFIQKNITLVVIVAGVVALGKQPLANLFKK